MSTFEITSHRVRASDGVEVVATLFEPMRPAVRTVIINAAMGVPQRFFRAFARHLAKRGLNAITWDYRGIGESAPQRLRGFNADIEMWAQCDLAAVIAWAHQRAPNTRILAVGQSLGGQILTLADNHDRVRALMLVSCPSGYWGHWPAPSRYAMWSLVSLGLPIFAATLGYFPAQRFGLGENFPAGVARQWGRWMRHPRYIASVPAHRDRMAAFAVSIRAYSFTDDGFAPRPAVDALLADYASARIEHFHMSPQEVGVRAIGHHGFFRPRAGGSLWDGAARWLSEV